MSERLFPGKTVNFILASKVIGSSLADNIDELAQVNTSWTPESVAQLNSRIDTIASEYLGVNTRNELFNSTAQLNGSLSSLIDKLVTFKKNIEVDFKRSPDYNTITAELGLNGINIHNLTQAEIIALVTNLKRKLTPELIAKLTSKGMPAAVPNSIVERAEEIFNLNNQQEKLKGKTKEVTGTMLTEMNALYEDIMKICKLAADYYKKDPVKKSMFTFTKVMKNMGEGRSAKIKNESAVS